MDYVINVPRLDWLIGGSRIGGTYNTYYGSCGTDGEKGFLGRKIFNYMIRIEKIIDENADEDTPEDEKMIEVIKASVYSGYNSFDNTDPDSIETEVFDLEENSRPIIKAWIEQKCREYFAQ